MIFDDCECIIESNQPEIKKPLLQVNKEPFSSKADLYVQSLKNPQISRKKIINNNLFTEIYLMEINQRENRTTVIPSHSTEIIEQMNSCLRKNNLDFNLPQK